MERNQIFEDNELMSHKIAASFFFNLDHTMEQLSFVSSCFVFTLSMNYLDYSVYTDNNVTDPGPVQINCSRCSFIMNHLISLLCSTTTS